MRLTALHVLAFAARLTAGVVLGGLLVARPACAQQSQPISEEEVTTEDEGVETLTAGPIHEAFASPAVLDLAPSPIVPKEPPPDVPEEPPPYLPEGSVWIPGYWAWDDERDDFVWVSGVARVPPPSMRYVPGYWAAVEGGWQRVAGFWTRDEETELEYRPAPPASLESGPSSPAPGDDFFWIPGCWVYRSSGYVWQTGYWAPYQPDWIWVPARWVWTPAGCLYVPGYWDYRLAYRGQLFAPIWFRAPIYRQPGWVWRPWCVIPTSHLFVHLWVRPQYCHYYFGNYYGTRYVSLGLIPWVNITIATQRTRIYDPFYTYCRVHYQRQGVDFFGRIQDWHRYYAQHEEARPARTWREQQQHGAGRGGASEPATQLVARRIDEAARQSDVPLKWVSLDPGERRRQIEEAQQVRELNRQRRLVELESQTRPPRPDKSPSGPRTSQEAPRGGTTADARPSEPAGVIPSPEKGPAEAAAAPPSAAPPTSRDGPPQDKDKPSAAPPEKRSAPPENRDAQPPISRGPRLKLPRPAATPTSSSETTTSEPAVPNSPGPKAKKAPPPPGARPGLASDNMPPTPRPTAGISPSRSADQAGSGDRRPSTTGTAPEAGKRPTLSRPARPETATGRTSQETPSVPATETNEKDGPQSNKSSVTPGAASNPTPNVVEKAPQPAAERSPRERPSPRTDAPSRPDPRPVPLLRTQQGKKSQANRPADQTLAAPSAGPATGLEQSAPTVEEAPARARIGDAPRTDRPLEPVTPKPERAERVPPKPGPAERATDEPRPADHRTTVEPRAGQGPTSELRPAERRAASQPRPAERPATPGPQLVAPRNAVQPQGDQPEPGQRNSGPQRLRTSPPQSAESRELTRPTPPVARGALSTPAADRPAAVAPSVRSDASRFVPPRASDGGGASAAERSGRPGRPSLTTPPASAAPRPSVAPPRSEPSPPRSPPTSRGSSGGRSKSREP